MGLEGTGHVCVCVCVHLHTRKQGEWGLGQASSNLDVGRFTDASSGIVAILLSAVCLGDTLALVGKNVPGGRSMLSVFVATATGSKLSTHQ